MALASGSAAQSAEVAPLPRARDMRVSFQLDDPLIDEARRAYVWRISWTAIYAGLAVGAVAAVPVFSKDDAPSLWIGAISSGVSAVYSWLFPLEVEAATGQLANLTDRHGSASRRARVRAMYTSASADERSRVTWPWHALNVGLALIPAIILWAGYDQLASGWMQFGAGVVLGEAALFTQPTGLASRISALQAHRGLSFAF